MKLPVELRAANTPAQVAGSNTRRIRKEAGVTLEALSIAAKRCGLKWSAGRVADFEAGRVELSLTTLVAIAQALADVTGKPVALAALLATEAPVEIAGGTRTDVAELLAGAALQPQPDKPVTPTEQARRHGYADLADAAAKLGVTKARVPTMLTATEQAGLVDRRAARALGISLADLIRHSVDLWGRGFTAQRDRVAGADADTARLGEVNRELRAQIAARIGGA